MAGKYLNSARCDPRPEFDQFVCQAAPPAPGYSLVDPLLDVNGTVQRLTGYAPDIEAQFTADFIADTPADQPFFAMFTPTTPHHPADDPRCQSEPVSPYRPPSYDEDTQGTGKPQYMQRGPLTPQEVADFDSVHERMTQATRCLDMAVGALLSSLGDREQDTLVIYLSDNGYLYGEHRRSGKQVPYEESVRVPFVVRFPALLPEAEPFTSDALVQNVDIAPTIADLVDMHWGADGLSFAPLLTGEASSIRDAARIEHCEAIFFPCEPNSKYPTRTPSFFGVVTPLYKYVEYVTGEKELYDLAIDPYEIVNHADDVLYVAVQLQLAGQLDSLTAPPEPDTTIVTGPSGVLPPNSYATFTYFSQSRFATYECRLDINGVEGTWGPCDGQSVTIGPLVDGEYVFNVRGTDENAVTDATPDTRAFSVLDASAPTTTITSGPSDPTTETTATFTFSADEDPVTFDCSLDGGLAEPCTSPLTYTGLSAGPHTFSVAATDGSGNVGTAPTWSWTISDVVPPTTTITSGPSDPTAETTATFTFSADEDPVTFSCSLDGGLAEPCTSPLTYTGLAQTGHTFSVSASDTTGNTGNTATWTWTIIDVAISVQDNSFTPKSPIDSRGGAVRWTFNGPSEHTATDRSGMALFDSGPTGPGGSYTVAFVGAGKYLYGCTIHPEMAGSIRVPIDASPPTGSISTSFFVTWAAEDAPAGFVYDVQIRRPGASRWAPWMNGVTMPGDSFVADAGTGSYGFRGRLRSATNGAFSRYSPAAFISVTS